MEETIEIKCCWDIQDRRDRIGSGNEESKSLGGKNGEVVG